MVYRAPRLAAETMLQQVDFTPESLGRLEGVNPALRNLMMEVERRANEQGYNLQVSEGLRDPERQKQLVAEGASQTMNSRHLKGNAIDVHLLNPDGSANWDFEAYEPIADIAKEVAAERGVDNFVWGGDWKSLKDGVHFEIADSDYVAPAEVIAAVQSGDMTKSEAARYVSEDLLDGIAPEAEEKPTFMESLGEAAAYLDASGIAQAPSMPSSLPTSIDRGQQGVGSQALSRMGIGSLA